MASTANTLSSIPLQSRPKPWKFWYAVIISKVVLLTPKKNILLDNRTDDQKRSFDEFKRMKTHHLAVLKRALSCPGK